MGTGEGEEHGCHVVTMLGLGASAKSFKLHGLKWEGTEGRYLYLPPLPVFSPLPISQYVRGQRLRTEFSALIL